MFSVNHWEHIFLVILHLSIFLKYTNIYLNISNFKYDMQNRFKILQI